MALESSVARTGWKRIWDLYRNASDLSPADRATYLAGLADTEDRLRVQELLEEEDSLTHLGLDWNHDPDISTALWPPQQIGPYHLIEPIGEGGMGTVYLARQEEPLKRTVALKLIRSGRQNRETLARFELERQTLARMNHPNIARVFDAGAAPGDHPFFVMEYVPGLPFIQYCNERRLAIRERLELFVSVCDAIQHAHQRGVIHRDIKPSNVLVVDLESGPLAKVIDFGIAKAIDEDQPPMTQVGNVMGTLDYMSPEQAVGGLLEIDTRSDVYSLGVLLYETLCGATPHGDRVLPPSRVAPGPLPRDVDWIVLKAIERDRDLRYQSAGALGQDLRRFLRGEIVEAGPPSRAYRLKKLARRYRHWIAIGCAFAAVLISATAISVRMAILAEREAATARAVSEFLQNDILAQGSPREQARARRPAEYNLTVREAVRRAADRIGEKFADRPLLRAEMEQTIGRSYFDLGLFREARRHFEQAMIARRAAGLSRDRGALELERKVVATMIESGDLREAEARVVKLAEEQERVLGKNDPDTLTSLHSLAALYRRLAKHEEAATLQKQVYEARKAVLGERHEDTLRSANNLGLIYFYLKRYDDALQIHHRTLNLRRETIGPEHPDTLVSMQNLARAYLNQKRYDEAIALFRETYDIQQRVVGPENDQALATKNNMGYAMFLQGRYREARAIFEELIPVYSKVLGPGHADTLNTRENLALVHARLGEWAAAQAMFREIAETLRRTVGESHPQTINAIRNLEEALARRPPE
jgi:serine/threonine protein kinase